MNWEQCHLTAREIKLNMQMTKTITLKARFGSPPVIYKLLCLVLLLLIPFKAIPISLAEQDLPQLIQEIFPKATVIGEKEKDYPVWPVYQLQELLGYAYLSNDWVDLPGFSGDRINLLIGLGADGRFQGIRVFHHHEPIFLHGLGPQPMLNFIDQFTGHLVTERIIVGSKSRDQGSANTAYFDGVTKATVSVIVINDTILSSALQVARSKLADFASKPKSFPRMDYFESLNWEELLQQGLVKKFTITRKMVEAELGHSLDNYPDSAFSESGSMENIQIYYAYLNPPTIGRNFLGKVEYERLMTSLKPNWHALAIMSEGFFSYLEEDFKPGTIPSRIGVEQSGLSVPVRDFNFYNSKPVQLAEGIPRLDNLEIFTIVPQSGFDPGSPITLNVNLSLQRNHLITDRTVFSDNYEIPDSLLSVPEIEETTRPLPPWARIWLARLPLVGILLIALSLLTVFMVRQHRFTKSASWFHRFRWAFLLFTLIFIGFYAQGQLSVVNIYTLFLEIFNGFDLVVFLLDPIIFILWIYTFITLFVWGRGIFCGWLCPFGVLQEMAGWIAEKLSIKQVRLSDRTHRILLKFKYLILFFLVGLAFYSLRLAETFAEVEPFKTSITLLFIRSWPFVLYSIALLVISLFIHKFYCRYLCALGAGLAIIGRFHRFEWLTRRRECGKPCQVCRHRCGINAINSSGAIDYDECIQCLECLVVYQDEDQCAPQILANKKKPSISETRSKIAFVEVT